MGVYRRRQGSEGRHWGHGKVALVSLVAVQQRTVTEAQILTLAGFLGLGHFHFDWDRKKRILVRSNTKHWVRHSSIDEEARWDSRWDDDKDEQIAFLDHPGEVIDCSFLRRMIPSVSGVPTLVLKPYRSKIDVL